MSMRDITTDNSLVMNQGLSPLVGFNFMLRVEALYDLPCKSIKSFTRELEYDTIQEGGLNDYVHMRRKQITKPFTLEIERYVGIDYVDPLPLGADLLLPVLLFVSRYPGYFIPFMVARTYTFTGCSVIKKTYGDLVGDNSSLLLETTTLAYRELAVVDIPWSQAGKGFDSPTKNDTQAELARMANEKSALERLKIDIRTLVDRTAATYDTADKQEKDLTKIESKLKENQTKINTMQGKLKSSLTENYSKLTEAKAETAKCEDKHKAALSDAQKALEYSKRDPKPSDADDRNDAAIKKLGETQKALDDATTKQKKLNDLVRSLEDVQASLPAVKSEVDKAVGVSQARMEEAKTAVGVAKASYESARSMPDKIQAMDALKPAQEEAQKARTDCRKCLEQASIVERTHTFLSSKAEKADQLLEIGKVLNLTEEPGSTGETGTTGTTSTTGTTGTTGAPDITSSMGGGL